MSEWWTYRPEDFLLFSPRVYWRMFELHNARLWPLYPVTLAVGVAAIFPMLRPARGAGALVMFLLAGLWIFVGWAFLWERYMTINWAIFYAAPAFGLEAVLLVVAGARGGVVFDRRDTAARAGWLVAAMGAFAYPLLAPVFGRPWIQAEVFGIAPDPTAIVTLGLMLSARGGLMPLLLLPIPTAWLLLSGLTLHTMGESQGWIAFAAAGTAAALPGLRLVSR